MAVSPKVWIKRADNEPPNLANPDAIPFTLEFLDSDAFSSTSADKQHRRTFDNDVTVDKVASLFPQGLEAEQFASDQGNESSAEDELSNGTQAANG
jgi:hypothetical protein